MPHQILMEVGAGDKAHPLFQLLIGGGHGNGVYRHIAGHTVFPVCIPLEDAGVAQRGHLHGTVMDVDLDIVLRKDVVLGDHMAQGPDLAVSQHGRRLGVHQGYGGGGLRIGEVLRHAVLDIQNGGIGPGVEELAGEKAAKKDNQDGQDEARKQDPSEDPLPPCHHAAVQVEGFHCGSFLFLFLFLPFLSGSGALFLRALIRASSPDPDPEQVVPHGHGGKGPCQKDQHPHEPEALVMDVPGGTENIVDDGQHDGHADDGLHKFHFLFHLSFLLKSLRNAALRRPLPAGCL